MFHIIEKRLWMSCLILCALGASTAAWSYETYITVTPPWYIKAVVAGDSSPSEDYGSNSWKHDPTVLEDGTNPKSEFYLPPSVLFGRSITIGELASVSWWTNKPPTTGTAVDWYLAIYTDVTRLNSEPYFTGLTVTPNTWHQWSSNDPSNPLRFFDQPLTGVFGTYTDPTLSAITSGPINWNNYGYSLASNIATRDYRTETIKYFSFQTGSGWSQDFTGMLDGFEVKLTNGDVGRVNFEVVPEPSSLLVGCGLLGLVFGLKRRQSRRTGAPRQS